ncbi:MAG: PLDc N-terminal domain-containing protein [Candidatus Bipolaricaulota bacterium]
MKMNLTGDVLLLVAPLAVIQILLAVIAIRDWLRRETYLLLSKAAWIVVIVVLGIVGPTLYLTLGRGAERTEGDGSHPE